MDAVELTPSDRQTVTTKDKKTEEERFVERLFAFRPDLGLPWRPGPEPPDFELGVDFEISLEVTRLSHRDDMAHRAEIQRFEEELEAALRSVGIRCVFVISYDEERLVLRKRSRRSSAVHAFVGLLETRVRGENYSHIYPPELKRAGLDWISHVIFAPAEDIAFAQGRYAVGNYEQRVADAVRRKSLAVANYPTDRYTQRWLLLVSQVHFSEPRASDIPADAAKGTQFDRVFFLDLQERAVTELGCGLAG